MKYSGLIIIGKNFSVSGNTLPTTINTRPMPKEKIISNIHVVIKTRIFAIENSSPNNPTTAIKMI
jgi:hypothetical protein